MTNETSNRSNTDRTQSGTRPPGTTTDYVASKMHDTVDRVADSARTAEREIRTRASKLGETAREQEERALEAIEANLQKARSYAEKNPLTSAGIAFVAGVLVSGLLFRR